MLNFSQLLPCRCFLLTLVLSACLTGPVSAQDFLPNPQYVLPTTITVTINSGSFALTDGAFNPIPEVYGIFWMAGNPDMYTPVNHDATPDWVPPVTGDFYFDVATYGYNASVFFEFWDFDGNSDVNQEDDFLGDRTATFDTSQPIPLAWRGLRRFSMPSGPQLPGADGGNPYFRGSIAVDQLRVKLDSGETWDPGQFLVLKRDPDQVFREVTVNSGGLLSVGFGALRVNEQGLLNINDGGLVTSKGSVSIDSGTVNLNNGGRLQIGTATNFSSLNNQGTFNWNSGTLEFLNGLSVSNTNSFNLADPEIRVGRTLKVNGELEIVSGGALIVSHGILDTRDNVVIDGGYLSANPSESGHLGRFDVAPGKTVTFRNNGVGVFDGNHQYSSGKTLEVLSGGDVKFGRRLALDDATLLVDGATSELTTNNTVAGTQFWGTAGGTTNATFRNGAQGFLKSGLALGTSGTVGTVGNLNVESDADVTLNGHTFVGAGTAGTGTLTVTGAGSTLALDFDYQLTVGEAGASVGMVHINDSGILRTGTSTTFIKPTGTIAIDGGTLHARGHMSIDGGALTLTSGNFDVNAGKFVTFTNNGQGNFSGLQGFYSGQTLEVFSGSDVMFNGSLDLGLLAGGGDGTIVVDGSGSTLTIGSTMAWGENGGIANVTFRNGAQGNLNDRLWMARTAGSGTVANLNVESNAVVSARSILLAQHTHGTATLTIAGSGSTLMQTGASTLTVGGTGSSMGMVNINGGGTLQTGTGTITINPTGTIAIDGGTLHARGHMSIDGGALTLTSGSFDVNAGKFMTFTNNGQGNFSVPQNFSSGQTLEVFSGSDVMVNGSLNLGTTGGGDGTIVVDGAGSTLTVGSPMPLGKNGGTANATFRNGAQGNLNNQLSMAFTGVPGTVANFNVESNAMVTARSIILASHTQGTATMTIAGSGSTLMQTGASTLTVGGTGSSMGTININGGGTLQSGTGTITINPTGNVNLAAGTFNARGILEIRGGTFEMNHPDSRTFADSINFYSGVFNLNDGLLSVTNFGGSLINNGGTLSPGQLGGGPLAGITGMTGDYTVNAGSLEINLGGLVPGNEHDYLDVFGNVTLGGTLEVSLIDAFALSPGQAFEIIDVAGLLSGTFNGLAEGGVVGNFGGTDLLISYTGDDGNDVVLFTENGVTADFDNDFDVDGADFLKWQRGQSPNPLSSSDLTDWQQNYGNPNPVAASSATVPEPTTGVTALSGLMSLLFRRRRLSYGPSVLGNRSVNSL